MKKYIAVGIGGAIGALLRVAIHQIPLPFGSTYRPLMTMFINISGSFFLGFLMILFAKRFPVKPAVRLGITTGLLGGYTTFSTLCKEAVMASFSGNTLFAAFYVAASVVFGLGAAWVGILAAKRLERNHTVC